MDRRAFLKTTALTGLAAGLPFALSAQDIAKLDFFVPANPGGGWDQTARLMDEILRAEGLIGTSMITNVGGAGGTVGLPQFVRQYDGESTALMTSGMVMVGAIITNQAPVTLAQTTPLALLTGEPIAIVVPAQSDIQTLDDLVAKLKADPGSVSIAGGGAGGADHILAGLLAQNIGVDPLSLSYVAFAGGGEALASLLGNQVSCGVSGWSEFSEQVASGKLRGIAISAPEAVASIPVPTMKSLGYDVELINWRGVFGPPNMPEAAVTALVDVLTKMNASEAWQSAIAERGWEPMFLAGQPFADYLDVNIAAIETTLKSLGLAS